MRGLADLPDGKQSFIRLVDHPQDSSELRGVTPLCLAAYLGKAELVQTLLEEGANVNARDRNGATPLMYAARDGHVDVVNVLLRHQADVNLADLNGWKAVQYGAPFPVIVQMMEAAATGAAETLFSSDLMDEISAKYPKFRPVSIQYTYNTNTRANSCAQSQKLLLAIKYNDLFTLARMLDPPLGVDVNKVEVCSGLTPLHYVLRVRPLRYPETETIVRMLVAAGANVNARNPRNGKTCFHYVVRDPYVIPEPHTTSTPSSTPNASIQTTVHSLTKFLLQCGANPNSPDNEGNRPLHYAVETNNFDLVRLLIDGRAAPDVFNNMHKKPEDLCKVGGDVRIRTLLTGRTDSVVEWETDPLPLARLSLCVQRFSSAASSEVGGSARGSWRTLPPSSGAVLVCESIPEEEEEVVQGDHKSEGVEDVDEPSNASEPTMVSAIIEHEETVPESETEDFETARTSFSEQQDDDSTISTLLEALSAQEQRTLTLEAALQSRLTNEEDRQTGYQTRIASLESDLESNRAAAVEAARYKRAYEDLEKRMKQEVEMKHAMFSAYRKAVERGDQLERVVQEMDAHLKESDVRKRRKTKDSSRVQGAGVGELKREEQDICRRIAEVERRRRELWVSGTAGWDDIVTEGGKENEPKEFERLKELLDCAPRGARLLGKNHPEWKKRRTAVRLSAILMDFPNVTEELDTALLTDLLYAEKSQIMHLRGCLDALTFEHDQLRGKHEVAARQVQGTLKALDVARRNEVEMKEKLARVLEQAARVLEWGRRVAEDLDGLVKEVLGDRGGLVGKGREVLVGLGLDAEGLGGKGFGGFGKDVRSAEDSLKALSGGVKEVKMVLDTVLALGPSFTLRDSIASLPSPPISPIQTQKSFNPPVAPVSTIQTMLDHLDTLRKEISRLQTPCQTPEKAAYKGAVQELTQAMIDCRPGHGTFGLDTELELKSLESKRLSQTRSPRGNRGKFRSPVSTGTPLNVLVEEDEEAGC
ncbi:hypothetical protein HK097_009216 [Rhizophlyctis rosea]|uniref:Ankyrin n=1 Tax=Rhizophlyctis rosea TaxID=64517 RepID=A0AAD5X0K8_9FUNG|nr:hypothetical protein HK097_009216 [Rhizophlyctis rosea]